ncbi:MAG: hypothetical protein IKU29_00195, partial [Parabacteroides sp.]|nr:hypothetical protein [Parabacteroides sp.]
IPDTQYNAARKKYAMTLEHMIDKYGEEVGRKKWEEYCKVQSLTNTFEYKKLKYNWTREQFDHYNKSRAATEKNLIKRHGEEVGRKKWEEYCKVQSIKKSWDYMVETHGIETAKRINRSKVLTHENFIRKYGEELGKLKWIDYINNRNRSFSKISQNCFAELDKVIGNRYQTFYANKNFEYPITTSLGNTYLLDFYIPELKICIEFNGSCFHGDERVFDDNEYCNPWDKSKTAKEIRESDRLRYNTLSDEFGIKTYVIWELDYNDKSFDADVYINNILHLDK